MLYFRIDTGAMKSSIFEQTSFFEAACRQSVHQDKREQTVQE